MSSIPHGAEIPGLPEAYHFARTFSNLPSHFQSLPEFLRVGFSIVASETRGNVFESSVIKGNALNVGSTNDGTNTYSSA